MWHHGNGSNKIARIICISNDAVMTISSILTKPTKWFIHISVQDFICTSLCFLYIIVVIVMVSGPHWWLFNISSGDGLMSSAIIWANVDPDLCCHMASQWVILNIYVHISPEWRDSIGVSEWVIEFNGLSGDTRRWGPYSTYRPCNHSLYIGIIIFPHIDITQSTGHN